jgi:hypothetical protein
MDVHRSGATDDLVIKDLAGELADLEVLYLEAMSDAITHRQLYLSTLDAYFLLSRQYRGLQQRLEQLTGMRAWHPEEL